MLRPPTEQMTRFLDQHRETHGVEPICEQLPIAPSTYLRAQNAANGNQAGVLPVPNVIASFVR